MQSGLDSPGGVQEGDILADKYRIEKILGTGGMGVVVAAQHIHLDDKVAIKFLLPEATRNPEAVARFAREARAAVKIKSEHVARVSDVGTLENGAPYMIMEYLEGGDLGDWLLQHGPLPVEQAVGFLLQACEAIAEAHALGIVHRDLKPANLFVIRRPDGALSVKVLDFGISKVTNPSASGPDMNMTKTSTMMGSPLYMSPEQMESAKSADARSDIWALGAILYELVAGEPPFNGETLPEVFTRILQQQPPPLTSYRPDLPPGFEAAVLKCLEKKRESRYQNVAELALALVGFGSPRCQVSAERISNVMQSAGLSTSVPPPQPQPQQPRQVALSAPDGTVAPWGNTAGPEQRGVRPATIVLLVAALAVGAVVVVGIGVFAFVLHRGPGHAAVAASAPQPAGAPSAPAVASTAAAAAPAGSSAVHPGEGSDAAAPTASALAAPSAKPAQPTLPVAKHAPAQKHAPKHARATRPATKHPAATKSKPKSPSLNSLINNRQ